MESKVLDGYMKRKISHHVGNLILAFDRSKSNSRTRLFLVQKEPKNKDDDQRKRKRVGIGRWVPPGGGREDFDHSQKHAAKRELWEESGEKWKIPVGDLRRVGLLQGYDADKRFPRIWNRARLKWIVHIYETVIPKDICNRFGLSKGIVNAGWFPITALPWDKMMRSDKYWLPLLISGQQLLVKVLFDYDTGRAIDYDLKIREFSYPNMKLREELE